MARMSLVRRAHTEAGGRRTPTTLGCAGGRRQPRISLCDVVTGGLWSSTTTRGGRVNRAPERGKNRGEPHMRSTLDKLVSWIGLGLAAVMLVAGGLLTWASNFVDNEVKTQFLAQDITMPDQKGIDALENQADKDAPHPVHRPEAPERLAGQGLRRPLHPGPHERVVQWRNLLGRLRQGARANKTAPTPQTKAPRTSAGRSSWAAPRPASTATPSPPWGPSPLLPAIGAFAAAVRSSWSRARLPPREDRGGLRRTHPPPPDPPPASAPFVCHSDGGADMPTRLNSCQAPVVQARLCFADAHLRSSSSMMIGAKSTSTRLWALPSPRGDGDLHELIADDVEPDEEHPVRHQFRSHGRQPCGACRR